ncbi:hypothetical protein AWB76_04917 [Caballeronia temeraria]|uniref:Uncharacterized protein n=1 Tax=Caballeronia temeraria TaxID=1777137 RepID=A0A158BZG0_9BURK|nr:hypothetical protein AWB76_04917 [Caballeronia temeraria]
MLQQGSFCTRRTLNHRPTSCIDSYSSSSTKTGRGSLRSHFGRHACSPGNSLLRPHSWKWWSRSPLLTEEPSMSSSDASSLLTDPSRCLFCAKKNLMKPPQLVWAESGGYAAKAIVPTADRGLHPPRRWVLLHRRRGIRPRGIAFAKPAFPLRAGDARCSVSESSILFRRAVIHRSSTVSPR